MALGMVLIVIVIIAFISVMAVSSLYSVSGVWERIENRESGGAAKEKISLGQLGPVVVGRRELAGGYQTFFGIALARTIWLKRRDYGSTILMQQGFPKEIVSQLEGQVLVRFKLRLSKDKLFLEGVLIPYKIEFTHQPPTITSMHALDAIPRKYHRAELISIKTATSVSAVSK